MDDNDTANDEPLSITESIRELWNRAQNPALTTSQKIRAVDPEMAKLYQKVKRVADGIDGITEHDRAILDKLDKIERRQGGGGKVWAWLKNVLNHAASEANKIRIE